MMTQTQKHNVTVVTAALDLLNRSGMTVDKLRAMREDFIGAGGIADEIDQLHYDSILAAIEIMSRPLYQ